jgi:hypothetical protein
VVDAAGTGSGFLARLKQAVFGNTAPAAAPVDADLLDSVNNWRFWELYQGRPDDEKIAAIAAAAKLYQMPGTPLCSTDHVAKIIASLKSLDAEGARIIFGFAASNYSLARHLKLNSLASLMERQRPNTFWDAQLRQSFERIKQHLRTNDCGHESNFAGSDVARRITALLDRPQASAAFMLAGPNDKRPNAAATDRMLEAWIDAWMMLITELRATRGAIDSTMHARWRQARRIALANRELGDSGDLMALDYEGGQRAFIRQRLSYHNERMEFPTFDRAWLAQLREQDAAWRKLAHVPAKWTPVRRQEHALNDSLATVDWSDANIPGALERFGGIEVAPQQSLLDFLQMLRTAKPPAKWSARAAALASGPQGPAIRQAITEWLAALPITGTASMRAKLWPDVAAYRNFCRRVATQVESTGSPESAALIAFFHYHAPFQIYKGGSGGYMVDEGDPAMLSESAGFLVRSAAWMLVHWRDAETVAALQRTAETMLMRLSAGIHRLNYRSLTAANACILVLGEIATPDAVQALGRIKLGVRDERLSKQIATAMEAAAAHAGMTVEELQELAVPTFDLDEVGVRTVSLRELTATLRVRSTTDVTVEIARADGKVVKAVPAAVKADAAASAALKELKAAAKSIGEALPVHRQRIESVYLTNRAWPLALWRERFLDHPLVGTLARRLIWAATAPDGTARSLMWHEGGLVDAAGAPVAGLADDHVVTLWHPLEAADEEAAAWRAFLMRHQVVQPFKQAHREVYPLTDAERAAGTYSNRFAGHILRQHQSVALARLRGWQATLRISADVPNDEPTHRRMPDLALAAELWTKAAGGDDAEVADSQAYVFISTDRVRFSRLLRAGNGRDALGDVVALDSIPTRVFSEVMRDVDLFVGVASIGNDPTWADGGPDAAHPSQWRRTVAQDYWVRYSTADLAGAGESRKQLLAELIPSLAIAQRCTLSDAYLTVRGNLRTYRIHLGSGNILMEGNRYLCVVPQPTGAQTIDTFLPFEGDTMLSLILSKAVMLAADDKITDEGILRQIRR